MEITKTETETANMNAEVRLAKALSSSALVPKRYQGNVADCMIAIGMAKRMRCEPLMVMQNLDVIQGKPSFSSTFLIALINSSGILKGRLAFDVIGEGQTLECTAYGTCSQTGAILRSPKVTMQMAIAEGWVARSGSKWKTMPELIIMYRSAGFFSRIYASDLTAGMHSVDELEDFAPEKKDKEGERILKFIEKSKNTEDLENLKNSIPINRIEEFKVEFETKKTEIERDKEGVLKFIEDRIDELHDAFLK
jgi:hypothetical protein